jgi:hypothetical protein
MSEHQKDEFLKDEYLLLQGFYEDFDRRALMVKGWSVTVAIAGLAVGFEKGIPAIWALAGVAALMFWIIDGKWRMYQYANRKRIKEIEAHFRHESRNDIIPLQAFERWWSGYEEQSLLKVVFYPVVMLPHILAVVLSAILIVVHYHIRCLV